MRSAVDKPPPDATSIVAAGVLGASILAGGVTLAIRARAKNPADPFLLQNRFVSELGWMAQSPLARVFNGSIVLGALLFVPVLHALRFRSRTRQNLLAERLGMVSIAAASGVGLCPMDNLKSHFAVTLVLFCTWPVTVALFTIGFWRDRTSRESKVMLPMGFAVLLSCVLLLISPKRSLFAAIRALFHKEPFTRPEIWWPAIFEWAVVFFTWLWMASATALLRSPTRGSPPQRRGQSRSAGVV